MSPSLSRANFERLIAELRSELDLLDKENGALVAVAIKQSRDLNDQCDTIDTLRVAANKTGLEVVAKRCLEMARTYIDQGDSLDSPRVRDCFRSALEAIRRSEAA